MAITDKNIKKLNLPVEGMTCAACVGHVENPLQSVPGMVDASVNLGTEKASVEFDSTEVTIEQIQEAVSGAGYKLGTQSASLNIGGMTCSACVSHIENAIREVPGVSHVNVNLGVEKASVEFMLQHQPHHLDIVFGVAPVAHGIKVAHGQPLVEADSNMRQSPGDLSRNKGLPTAR